MSTTDRSVTLRLPSPRRLIGTLAAVALIAGAVIAGIRTHDLAVKSDHLEHGLSSFETTAVATAQTYALAFATYHYETFDADVARTVAHSVDPFLGQYRNYTRQLASGIVKAKARSSAKVISAGLVSASATSAVVVLFVDQTIVNKKGTQSLPQRITMTMVRPHDRWLISRVQIFT